MNNLFITQCLKTFSDGSTAYYEDRGETIKVTYPDLGHCFEEDQVIRRLQVAQALEKKGIPADLTPGSYTITPGDSDKGYTQSIAIFKKC